MSRKENVKRLKVVEFGDLLAISVNTLGHVHKHIHSIHNLSIIPKELNMDGRKLKGIDVGMVSSRASSQEP
jgi:hypothetical protein